MNTTKPLAAAMAAAALALVLALAGCKSTPTVHFHPEEVRARMTELCALHRYQEAREVKVKEYPKDHPQAGDPSPEELVKRELVDTLVNPSETAWKTVGALQALLDAALDDGRADDEEVQRGWRLLFRAQDLMERQDWAGAADVADRGLELLGAEPVATSFPPSGVAGQLPSLPDPTAALAGQLPSLPNPAAALAGQLPSLPDPAAASRFFPHSLSEQAVPEGVYKMENIMNALKGSR